MEINQFDFIVVGGGLAGNAAALLLSKLGDVALVSKTPPCGSNSHRAQGGIAAAFSEVDSPELHLQDTLMAGDGLCNPYVVRTLTNKAPDLMRWLINVGVEFDRDATGQVCLGLEGAHSMPRILHAGGDATGANLLRALTNAVENNLRIHLFYDMHVRALLRANDAVHGVYASSSTGHSCALIGRKATILATGGLGQLFAHTTNPDGATGDGIALAYQAGARVMNMEFVQFHPTALRLATNPRFLISEAVRGAGARLINERGEFIMAWHPQGDLAPRDVVARTIYQIQQTGDEVYLDARRIADFSVKFPTIHEFCVKNGLNPALNLLPVSPAAHFAMGGVTAALNGTTNLRGLYAIGEVACTGVHGANRLASNSLLECLVMAHELASHLKLEHSELPPAPANIEDMIEHEFEPDETAVLDAVRDILWESAGIVRDHVGLAKGLDQINALLSQHEHSAALTTASLILRSAITRQESRGAHYRLDFPSKDIRFEQQPTLLQRDVQSLTSVGN